eukprot:scaffold79158_cov94-Cyclotella_meneghiniana.AAC.1
MHHLIIRRRCHVSNASPLLNVDTIRNDEDYLVKNSGILRTFLLGPPVILGQNAPILWTMRR